MLVVLPWMVVEVPEGYLSYRQGVVPLRRVGSKGHTGLPNPDHQSQERVPT